MQSTIDFVKDPCRSIQMIWLPYPDEKESWATKRRKELICKLKCNRAKLNKAKAIATICLFALAMLTLLALTVFAISNLSGGRVPPNLGILFGILIVLGGLNIWDKFETDPNFIKVQRKL